MDSDNDVNDPEEQIKEDNNVKKPKITKPLTQVAKAKKNVKRLKTKGVINRVSEGKRIPWSQFQEQKRKFLSKDRHCLEQQELTLMLLHIVMEE